MKKIKLQSIAKTVSVGSTPLRSTKNFWEKGTVCWVKSGQLGKKHIYTSDEKITIEAVNVTGIKINPVNTITIALNGEGRTRGSVSILKSETTTNQSCCNIVVDDEVADYNYIYYYLKNQYHYLRSLSSGARKSLNSNILKDVDIHVPNSKEEQESISRILTSIDAKIELNNKMNSELQDLAKLIYDYWFVQFDFPDENENPYKCSGGKMLYNEEFNKEIPKGWEVKRIDKVLKTDLGGTPSTKVEEYWNGDFPWLNSGEIANFPIIESELKVTESGISNSATTLMPKGSCVLSITRHLRPSILGVDSCANQSVVGLFESELMKASYIYPYLVNEIPRLMSLRTGAQQPHINKGIVDESLIIVPKEEVLNRYYATVDSMYEKIINNAFQNKELAELRDWLLPMLMNGQVKVKMRMEEIEYENRKLSNVEVELINYLNDEELKVLPLKEGLCVRNSFKVAEVKKGKMVEGFLVTKFKNKPLNCVAHVWNKIDEQYFDFTALIKKHDEEIESHCYYPIEEYDYNEKKIEMLKSNGLPPTNFELGIVELLPHIQFKTKIKEKELELLESLRNIEKESKKL